ncbi:MAG: uroporphyrinogen decarboxylase [Acidobacteriota bacterium]
MTSRERFLAACWRRPVDRPPVWMMRQAGRYLPEYREIRTRHSFAEMYKTPGIAAEVTMQPMRRFGMDAAIIFSDILVVPEAMGMSVEYEDGGPCLSPPISTREKLDALRAPRVDMDLGYVLEALRLVRRELGESAALLGFAGAPFTLATYMVEGRGSRDLLSCKRLWQADPGLVSELLERLAAAVTEFLRLQIAAGADAVQIFDTWAGGLSPEDYDEIALPYTRSIVDRLKPLGVPVIVYVNGISGICEKVRATGATVIGIDWRLSLRDAHARTGTSLQGNLDPAALFDKPERIRQRVRDIHASLNLPTGHIFNLGHGIHQSTPVEGARAFVDAVKELG